MSCTEILKARVSPEIKLQAKAIADRELLTEAAWLKRAVIREIRAADVARSSVGEPRRPDGGRGLDRGATRAEGCGKRVYVRLREEDRLLLEARAAGLEVRAWTVKDPGDFTRLGSLGVSAIFTDYPERFLHIPPS